MNDNATIELLNNLLTRMQSAPPRKLPHRPIQAYPHSYEEEVHLLDSARQRAQREEALMLTYIAKLEFVARRCRSLGLDHTSDLDDWLEANPNLPFVSLPTR